MKKILIVASVYSHIAQFHQNIIDKLKEIGYEVHIAGKDNLIDKPNLTINNIDKKYNYQFTRFPFTLKNYKVLKKLKQHFELEKYDLIYTHTPAASVLTRLAARKTRVKNNTKIIYMSHGFHFYKKGPIINWILYYPIEKIMSKYTDVIITINEEDYKLAKTKFKKTNNVKVNGVGVDFKKFNLKNYQGNIKVKLGIPESAKIITTIGELNNNKNQLFIMENLKELLIEKNVYYLIVGNGPNREKYEKYIKTNNLEKRMFLLGYRRDIPEILYESDIIISASKREGLGLNLIEAIASKKIVLASFNRGHNEILNNSEKSFQFEFSGHDIRKKVEHFLDDEDKYEESFQILFENIDRFDLNNVNNKIMDIIEKEVI